MTDPTDTSAEAVERLARSYDAPHFLPTHSLNETAATLRALAAENAALRAERDRLREALRVVALVAQDAKGACDRSEPVSARNLAAGVLELVGRYEAGETEVDRLRAALEQILTLPRTVAPSRHDPASDAWWANLCARYRQIAAAALTAPPRPEAAKETE